MLTIIPAIDIIGGKCVRLSRGDYTTKKVYNGDPVEVACLFEDHGMQRLHLVDLDGAREKHIINWHVLEEITGKTKLKVDFGGGIHSDNDLKIVFNSGAEIATIGSVAVKDKDLFFKWIDQYGTGKFILGADVKDRKIAISGWLETTELVIDDFINEYTKHGVTQILCTDISRDGMLEGTSLELYKYLMEKYPKISLIASGGITKIDELFQLDEIGVSGAVIGKAIYEGKITLKQLGLYISEAY